MTSLEIDSIFSLVSGVLLLGNVEITAASKQGVPDAAAIDSKNQIVLKQAARLLFLDYEQIVDRFLTKTQKAGNQTIQGVWKKDEANILKDSLAKVIMMIIRQRLLCI